MQQVLNEAGTDEKCNLHGVINAGGIQGGALCQPSYDRTGLLCVKHKQF